jgi:hypothetical protein
VELVAPDLEFVPIALAADRDGTRGLGRQPVIASAVALGLPVVQRITEELVGEDEALREFIRHSSWEWQFHLVHLGCSFRPGDGMHIAKACVAVSLNSGKTDDANVQAIVWSLVPQRMDQPVDVTKAIKLGAKLAFAEVALEVTSAGKGAEVFVQAYGLQESSCSWEFYQTPRYNVSGTHRLALVVRSSRGQPSTGQVTVEATVSYRRFSLMPFRSELANQPPIMFDVNGSRSLGGGQSGRRTRPTGGDLPAGALSPGYGAER